METCMLPWAREDVAPELTSSIIHREFMPLYQPLVQLSTGDPVGWEALGHWIHPTRGLLPSGAFMAAAEASRLVGFVDDIVIDRALRRFHRFAGGSVAPTGPWMALQVSARRFLTAGVVPGLLRALDSYDVPASRVLVEVVDFAALADRSDVIDSLIALRSAGLSVAIDSGSAGYGSLYLGDLPIDFVRLDSSLVAQVADVGPGEAKVVEIVARALNAGVPVFADGVETPEQSSMLSLCGCFAGQGPLFGEPDADLTVPRRALVTC